MRVRLVVLAFVCAASGCLHPVGDCVGADCDAGTIATGGSTGTGTGGGSHDTGGGSTGTGGGSPNTGGGSPNTGGGGAIVVGGVTYEPDGGLVCPRAVTVFPSAADCNPATCSDGCCDGARCIRGCAQSNQRCGVFAEACTSCFGADVCQSGTCRGTGACTGCRNTDICSSGTLPGSCGGNGESCTSCAACVGQRCVNPPIRVGDACATDGDCAALGRGASCRHQTSPGALSYPGGFCTLPCEGTYQACAGNSECVSFPTRFGETARLCAPTCSSGGDGGTAACRAGYACYEHLGWSGARVCWISPAPALVGTAPIGSPCVDDTDCGTARRCLRPYLPPDYKGNGYYGGYCTADCTPGAACGDGEGICISERFATPVGPATISACKAACSAPGFQGECRTEYLCQGSKAGAWCAPPCLFRTCPDSQTCDFNSGLCR